MIQFFAIPTEARYDTLGFEFTPTWEQWRATNAAEDAASRLWADSAGN